jgi:hypothetical protein
MRQPIPCRITHDTETWRAQHLQNVLEAIVYGNGNKILLNVENAKIWYDSTDDFHRLSFNVNGKTVIVRHYKVTSFTIDGKDVLIGSLYSRNLELADDLRKEFFS